MRPFHGSVALRVLADARPCTPEPHLPDRPPITGAVGGRAMMYPLAGVPPGSRRDVIDGPPYLGTDRTWAYLNETTPRYYSTTP